jgi:hypothetical protein
MPNSPETNQAATPVAEQKSEPPTIEIRERITRTDLHAEKEKIFLFGDNLAERGYGGQAREMRGEENAVGIPTKKAPDNRPASFFIDKELAENKQAIDAAFGKIPPDKIIVIPKAGIGTGLAQLAEKAPLTFAYLNEKLAEIGFDNERGKFLTASKNASQNKTSNTVVVQSNLENPPAEKRLLDLNDIETRELLALAPSRAEVDALKTNRTEALAEYADRLRQDYKENKNGLREGFKILSDALDRGGQITISCSCRTGSAMCHADVIKMAIEKVSLHLKNQQIQEKGEISRADDKNVNRANSQKQQTNVNPRTQRAINEILSLSENDKLLETISQTDGRNRSEQASFLGKSSQFVRDIYERGANVVDGKLIIPTENLNSAKPLSVTTQEYAVKKLGEVLKDESKAKEIAPLVVEYGNKISGLTADGETKIKVFNWVYDSLEGKNEFLDRDGEARQNETTRFDNALEKISRLAGEMHELEPLDKIEFVPLAGLETETNQREFDDRDENRLTEEIYEEALSREATDGIEKGENAIEEAVQDFGRDGSVSAETFERIDLSNAAPRLPQEFSEAEVTQFLTETLPDIDRRLESGEPVKEVLADFHRIVRRSAQEDALNRLEKIYQRHSTDEIKTDKIGELSQSIQTQIGQIDLCRQNVIELKSPGEFLAAESEAHRTFYRRAKQEIGSLLEKFDSVRETHQTSGDKSEEILLKKQLNQIKEAKPSFAYKLENSPEVVVGNPSAKAIEARNFAQGYINYQLKQPETRLRFESERYRNYAAQLESATTRSEVMKTASTIRAENASLGLNWKELQSGEKDKLPRPLSQKEMQFLFTETSPTHYTQEMTVARLSYAHAGASRRQATESLLKGEIQPSAEAGKLIESLESRLNRRELRDSISATRHFFESLKTPNENLKIKNDFDHAGVYRSLPPQEKDFVYQRTTQQKENLEYRFAYDKSRISKQNNFSRDDPKKLEASQAEKSFNLSSLYNQARILGEKIESPALVSKEIGERDFNSLAILLNNESPEKNELISRELKASGNSENRKLSEILEVFNRAEITKDEQKTVIQIKLPENSVLQKETFAELLEKLYPDSARENDKYKFSSFGEKFVSESREKGQDETLKDFREQIKASVDKENVLGNDLSNDQSIAEKFETLRHFQEAGRAARRENESILSKYASRAAARTQNQILPALQERKEIVTAALGIGNPKQITDKIKTEFFQAVQKEITVSDYQKFAANEKLIADARTGIRIEFAEISKFQNELEKSKTADAPEKTHPKINESVPQLGTTQTFDLAEAKNQEDKVAAEDLTENKPLSLKLYENEIARAEKQLISKSLSAKILAGVSYSESEFNLNLDKIFSRDEHDEMKLEALEIAKSRLEPKELDADHRKISNEASRQAIATFKQLEQAHNVFQLSGDAAKINEAFLKLDREAAQLNKIRQDYTRAEKLAVLREGIKTDIVDLLKKNLGGRDNNFVEQAGKVLAQNLEKAGVMLKSSDNSQVDKLSREIINHIEAKQKQEVREFTGLSQSQNLTNQNSTKTNTTPKFEKAKDSFVLAR